MQQPQPQQPQPQAQQPYPQGMDPYPQPPAPQRKRGIGRILLYVLGAILVLGVLGSIVNGGDDRPQPQSGAAPAATGGSGGGSTGGDSESGQAAQNDAAPARIGQEVRDGKFAFTVTKVETGVNQVGSGFTRKTAQGQYVLVHVTVQNIGTEAQLFSDTNQKLIDDQGRRFDADTDTAVLALPQSEAFLNNINPGNSVQGILLFDVPKDAKITEIELHDSMFSAGVRVSLTQ